MLAPWCAWLALNVLVDAVADGHKGDWRARQWIEADSDGLRFWCALADVRPSALRRALADPGWPARLAEAKAKFETERQAERAGRFMPASDPDDPRQL
jgi:hypothetical protein